MRLLRRLIVFCVVVVLGSQLVFGQSTRIVRVNQLENALSNKFDFNKQRLDSLSKLKGVPLKIVLDNSATAELQFFDEQGEPVYYTTFNTNAASTTTTTSLQNGGSLNLNLEGNNLIVGVWDQDAYKTDHIEFGSRVSQRDGNSNLTNGHGTHVMGTILAQGVNSQAKGMAVSATGWAFDWNNDLTEMLQNAYDPELRPEGILISNHSYGIITGWRRNGDGTWSWFGNSDISNEEDYRFGFYSAKSKGLDDIAYEFPYYSIFWAAGNDRSDVGDGTRPQDGPDDTIGPEGVAKNVFTVGAVRSLSNYQNPSDIQISTFSSWGPTDDGRIKPDVVGMGVGVLSSYFSNSSGSIVDSYASLNGTSMATPNVAGSLLLVQELYASRNNQRFMRSATLKALAIHTAKEAGQYPGPDYIHGWGLLDTEEAAQHILLEDEINKRIVEEVLSNGDVYEFEFTSTGLSPIKVTIAWTDPSGQPVSAQLDPIDLMLVNDLDLRIVDESGNIFYPWTLNPAEGVYSPAKRDADNFRDNVEQILIDDSQPRRYTVRVTHKGSLINGVQPFSLIFSAETESDGFQTLYWKGVNSNWNDIQNWSLQSGGASANQIPDSNTRVVIDNNSNTQSGIVLNEDIEVNSINLFTNDNFQFDLNSFDILINKTLRASSNNLKISNGQIIFKTLEESINILDFGGVTFENVLINIDSGTWRILSASMLDHLYVSNGASLDIDELSLNLNAFEIEESANVDFTNSRLINLQKVVSLNSTLDYSSIQELNFTHENALLDISNGDLLNVTIGESTNLNIVNFLNIDNLILNTGVLTLGDNISVSNLYVTGISKITFDDIYLLDINESLEVDPDATLNFEGRVTDSDKSKMRLNFREKICFNSTSITFVDLISPSVVSISESATLDNSSGWINFDCEDVLFADFNVLFACSNANTNFVSISQGDILRLEWEIDGQSLVGDTVSYTFENPGQYEVLLKAYSDSGNFNEFSSVITISENNINRPSIVVNNTQLASSVSGGSYQWFRNGSPIPGATSRTFNVELDGLYEVLVQNQICNILSEPISILSTDDSSLDISEMFGLKIFPNPLINGKGKVEINNEFIGDVLVTVYDFKGSIIHQDKFQKNSIEYEFDLTINKGAGIYLVKFLIGDTLITKKIIK